VQVIQGSDKPEPVPLKVTKPKKTLSSDAKFTKCPELNDLVNGLDVLTNYLNKHGLEGVSRQTVDTDPPPEERLAIVLRENMEAQLRVMHDQRERDRELEKATGDIQRLYRGHATRNKRSRASTKIQKVYRGHLGR
jgi:hypothetical protein